MDSVISIADLCEKIAFHRFNYRDEQQLQDGIELLLKDAEIPYEREKVLGPNSRPDFLVDGIAVEVKIKHSLADLTRQVYRYASNDAVRSIIVVTPRMRLSNLPDVLFDKPIRVVTLMGAFG
jgi:hypothetical protein